MFLSQGKALAALGIEGELLLILYSMIDHHDPESAFASFWESLPKILSTGDSLTIAQRPLCLPLLAMLIILMHY